jgi:hypothetical protein
MAAVKKKRQHSNCSKVFKSSMILAIAGFAAFAGC